MSNVSPMFVVQYLIMLFDKLVEIHDVGFTMKRDVTFGFRRMNGASRTNKDLTGRDERGIDFGY